VIDVSIFTNSFEKTQGQPDFTKRPEAFLRRTLPLSNMVNDATFPRMDWKGHYHPARYGLAAALIVATADVSTLTDVVAEPQATPAPTPVGKPLNKKPQTKEKLKQPYDGMEVDLD
jgi:hypothetical protein